jgi:hypothetical protein
MIIFGCKLLIFDGSHNGMSEHILIFLFLNQESLTENKSVRLFGIRMIIELFGSSVIANLV